MMKIMLHNGKIVFLNGIFIVLPNKLAEHGRNAQTLIGISSCNPCLYPTRGPCQVRYKKKSPSALRCDSHTIQDHHFFFIFFIIIN